MVLDFFQNYKWDGRPWLIVGMGPTFSLRHNYDLSAYNILGLNKVVREMPVDLCQIIDHYIIPKVARYIDDKAKYLVVPYYPHFHCRPWFEMTLDTVLLNDPLLKKLSEEDRLLAFNLSTFNMKRTTSPMVRAKFFSSEAAVSLLAQLGVKKIKLLGIDGGHERAEEFSDHGPCDPRGFDLQWKTINENVEKYDLHIQHLVRNPDGLHSR